jgi:hypothetical protein
MVLTVHKDVCILLVKKIPAPVEVAPMFYGNNEEISVASQSGNSTICFRPHGPATRPSSYLAYENLNGPF